jgi:hypothetical protein
LSPEVFFAFLTDFTGVLSKFEFPAPKIKSVEGFGSSGWSDSRMSPRTAAGSIVDKEQTEEAANSDEGKTLLTLSAPETSPGNKLRFGRRKGLAASTCPGEVSWS